MIVFAMQESERATIMIAFVYDKSSIFSLHTNIISPSYDKFCHHTRSLIKPVATRCRPLVAWPRLLWFMVEKWWITRETPIQECSHNDQDGQQWPSLSCSERSPQVGVAICIERLKFHWWVIVIARKVFISWIVRCLPLACFRNHVRASDNDARFIKLNWAPDEWATISLLPGHASGDWHNAVNWPSKA